MAMVAPVIPMEKMLTIAVDVLDVKLLTELKIKRKPISVLVDEVKKRLEAGAHL